VIFFLIACTSFSLDHIWLIRHCDKTNDSDDPCCSQYGYQRADNWYKYFSKYIHLKSSIQIYASNYNEKKQCIANNDYKPNSSCQKSQRMFITGLSINDKMTPGQKINIDYCIGEYKDLVDTIESGSENEAIVVWEHKEIVNIINRLGIALSDWPDSASEEYNVVFMVDYNKQRLYYDCYNFIDGTNKCSDQISSWLKNYGSIESYYMLDMERSMLVNITYSSLMNYSGTNSYILMFLLVFGLCCGSFCLGVYLYYKNACRKINKHTYVELVPLQPSDFPKVPTYG